MSPLNVVICGAGLAGLCTAVGLRRKGHEVLILESHKELSEVGSGIQVPTNATREGRSQAPKIRHPALCGQLNALERPFG